MEICRGILEVIRNFESLEDKMVNLKRRWSDLESREEDVRSELDYADSFSMRKRRRTVENWLNNVGEMRNQVQQLEQKVRQRRFIDYLRLPRTLDKVKDEVQGLIQSATFPEGVTLKAYDNQGLPFQTTELVGQKFEEQKNLIQESITRDDNVLRIGIHGMGGVGKTTLVQHVHNELLNHSNYSLFWVVASQNCSILELQNKLGEKVKKDLLTEETDVNRRAAELAQALNRRKNSVIFIDDLWEYFPLESLGMVREGGCKLVFTTRNLEVCNRMESHKIIKVEILSDEEARKLFMKTLGIGPTLTPQIEEIAKALIKECVGLPLGIITVAGSMRGVDDICEWNNALETLRQATRRQDDHMQLDKVFEVLRYSFDMLKDQTLQDCFLYCSLYPEDHEIGRYELIAKFIDEGLISRKRTRQAEFDRGHTILNKLEKVCLLQVGITEYQSRYVKMHDLIRDMALLIASSRFLVVTEHRPMEEENWSVELERVSFYNSCMYNSASQPMCPRLSTLLLVGCRGINGIPNSFFMHMDKLTVLDLSRTPIVNLPVSVSNLKSLSALLLRGCESLEKLCPLSDLRALKRLDLSYSRITELPEGMDLLTNLRDLSLSGAYNLQMIPEGILPKLSHLQHLKLPSAFGIVKVRGEEIASLRKLEIFHGKFYNIYDLHIYINSWEESRPNEYRLFAGEYSNREITPPGIEKTVHIIDSPDLVMLCQLDFLKKASDLRTCVIDYCQGMTHFFCTVCYNRPFVERLESLHLWNLNNLRELLSGERCSSSVALPALSTGAFSSLTSFEISFCNKIKKLFTRASLSQLQNLEFIRIFSCAQLVEIVQVPDEDQDQEATGSTSIIFTTLPKLNKLHLSYLPKLKCFCSTRKLVSDSLKEIRVNDCPKLERLPLFREVSHSPTWLRRITVNKQWWESIEFDLPNTKDILTPICEIWQ